MNRIEVINQIFQKTSFKNYLEIGSRTGTSLLQIKAKNKIAVDPVFRIPIKSKVKWFLLNPTNLFNKYFEVKSDTFFKQEKEYLKNLGRVDVVLIDGLHTFQTSLNDVLNSLQYLNKNGIIILHDCYPKHKLAALPLKKYGSIDAMKKIKGWRGDWNGDVWKTIVYLREKLSNSLDVCVINSDHGLGIVRPKNSIDTRNLRIDEKVFTEIDELSYEDLVKDVNSMLNLKDKDFAFDIIKDISLNMDKN